MICPNCERKIDDDAKVCEYCGKEVPEMEEETNETENEYYIEEPKPLKGFLGAVLGALVSGGLIVLLSMFGFAQIGGLVIAFCVYVGYRLMSRTMTKIGLGVCIMLTLMTPYLAYRMGTAVWIMQSVTAVNGQSIQGLSLFNLFLIEPVLINEIEAFNLTRYFMDLFQLYLFTLVGGVAYYGTIFKRRKLRFKSPRL